MFPGLARKLETLGPERQGWTYIPRQYPINDAVGFVRSGPVLLKVVAFLEGLIGLLGSSSCNPLYRRELGSQNDPFTLRPGAVPDEGIGSSQLRRWTSWSPSDAVAHRVIIDFSSNGGLPILAGQE